jgi:uracil-DNA glycosylase
VQSEVVIALGLMATNGILHAYNLNTYSVLRKAVEIEEGIRLGEKTRLFPMYHCGNRGVNQNRNMEEQLKDWRKIGRYLGSEIPAPVPVSVNRTLLDY